ncbi:ABC transporter ATP-binding protein [Nocardia sp. NPDC052254]|uniref:ABC transporter ATP-binding protein n=1 Tax=Nocardia sp. NPDC052254 TaxID=3155681 RepID=UPI003426FA70
MTVMVTDVSYSYGARSVLRGLTWELTPGVTLLLGPNGSGKSTLLGLLATRLALGTGDIVADGRSWADSHELVAIRRTIGWAPQSLDVDRAMRVRDFVAYSGWLRGMSTRAADDAAQDALHRLGLATRGRDRIRALSGGMQRRALIAAGIVHSPSVLVLDEPTAGLDPKHRRSLNSMIEQLGRDGVVVVVATHISEDAESADRIGILSGGVLVANGTPRELETRFGSISQAYIELTDDGEDTEVTSA